MPYKYNPLPPNFDRVNDISGAVFGPGSSTDNALVRWDGTSGELVQDSNAILSDAGVLTLAVPLPIASGGTAASTAPVARSNLGLGTIATQDANNVSITGGSITGITDLAVADGGTGSSSFTTNGLIYGNGASPIQSLGEAANGQIPIGSIGNPPVLANIIGGPGISIANGAGSITISLTGGGNAIDTILTDSGAPPVEPDANGQLSILGGTGMNVTGSGGNTVTVALETPVSVANGGTGVSSITGLVSGNGAAALVGRTLQQPAAGITISNASGATADPTFALADDLAALEGLATTGLAARTAASTWTTRTITGTANQISVNDGDGVSGNPTLALTSTIQVNGISFNAGANTLSNYSEGTFTPTITGQTTAGTTTYATQGGFYIRIGNLTTVQGVIVITGATGTGNAVVGGLPFTIKNQATGQPVGSTLVAGGFTWPASTTSTVMQGTINSTDARIYCTGSAVSGGYLQMANTSLTLYFTMTYQI